MTDSFLNDGPLTAAQEAAQAQEDEDRPAGPPEPLDVDPAGQVPNPEGYTPVGEGEMATPIEQAPTEPPTEPPTEGRGKIDQTPQAGDKTGGAEIWENPEQGQKADTSFDVSFNEVNFKLDEGQRIRVFLDVTDQQDDAIVTTAEPEDWAFAVTSKDPGLDVVASELADGQLVATLEAVRDGVNLTGDVFRVEVTAIADAVTEETPELLVFDINDDVPALDLATNTVIGADWDNHDDVVITIQENPALAEADEADAGALVEAYEAAIELEPPLAPAGNDLALELLRTGEADEGADGLLADLPEGFGDAELDEASAEDGDDHDAFGDADEPSPEDLEAEDGFEAGDGGEDAMA